MLLTDNAVLSTSDLPPEIREADDHSSAADSSFRIPAAGLVLEDLERDLVRQALEMADGNRTHAARLLGMNRDQIRYRIKKFNLGESASGAEESQQGQPAYR